MQKDGNLNDTLGSKSGKRFGQLKYQVIETEIRQLAKTLPFGAKLPAERDLAITYNCNFLTVRKALKQLVDDGSVVRRVGSGTFIAKHPSPAKGERRVGVLVHKESNPYSYRVLQAVAHAGLEQDLDLRSGWIGDFGSDALSQVQRFKDDDCVALTLPWFPHEKLDEVREFVKASPLPISLSMLIPGLERNCFEEQSVFGSTHEVDDLCSYFQNLGHRRIAMLGPETSADIVLQKRLTAFVCYTSRENMPSPCGLVPPGGQAMDQLAERWKSYKGDLAIISYDDEHALRFMTAMHKIGLNAPEDYQIVGYNDTEASRYSDPPLSTIHQNFDYIGYWLLKSALGLAAGSPNQSTSIPHLKLLVRESCGGRGKIDDAFRSKFSDLDIILEGEKSGKPAMQMTDKVPSRI